MRQALVLGLLLGLTSTYLLGIANGHTVLRNRHRPRHDDNNKNQPRQHKASSHRKLQRAASICTDNPDTFTSSLQVDHEGDGTPFREADLDMLLQLALLSFNQIAAETCDWTFRTLSAVSVGNVFYTEELKYVRLRYDLTGSCEGCVPSDPNSGKGPMFGAYEMTLIGRRTQQNLLPEATNSTRRQRRIKGLHSRRRREQEELQTRQKNSNSRKKSNVCDCQNDEAYSNPRGPTYSEFAMTLNDMIAAARKDGILSGVEYVSGVSEAGVAGQSTVLPTGEARAVSCDNQLDFTTDVWVEFEQGADLTEAEKLPMEVALLETFNEMRLLSCDVPFFRMVSGVTHMESRASGDKLQMRFQVTGLCVNCDPANINLFDTNPLENPADPNVEVDVTSFRPPTATHLLAEIEQWERLKGGPILINRVIPTSCVCPLNTEGLPLRSPTTSEFSRILQASLNTLISQNLISSVQEVVRVEESEIDSVCSGELITFVSTFFAEFGGKPEDLNPTEIATLEGGFKQTYNDLIYNSCDQYFRSINNVRLTPGISRRRRKLQATNVGNAANSSDVPDLQSEAPSVYMVAGECRGCPVRGGGSFPLTDDAFRFRKLMVGGKEETIACYSYGSAVDSLPTILELPAGEGDILSRVQQEERRLQQCLCAPGTLPNEPSVPTPNDFRLSYNDEIVEYNRQGTVTNVQEVTSLEELPPGLVQAAFSLFYGTLARLGTPTEADYGPLMQQTNTFYRRNLIEYYDNVPGVTLRAVTLKRGNTTERVDLDMYQVDFAAELIFEDALTSEDRPLPTRDEITNVMANFSYVEYITDYIWALNTLAAEAGAEPSVFRRAHSVRFAGREAKVVDLALLFTVRADRTSAQVLPNREDRVSLGSQINTFFFNHLRTSGFYVTKFTSHIDAENIRFTGDGLVLVDFDATVMFSTVEERPSQTELVAIMKTADLESLKTQLLIAPRRGTAVFSEPFDIAFSNDSP